jgi:hypothetical protein
VAGEFLGLRLERLKLAGGKQICALGRAIAILSATQIFLLVTFAQHSSAPVQHMAKSSQARARHKKHKPDPPLITEASPQPAPPPAPPPTLTPEQMPPRTPEITWDGQLLSINAENSTLSDILVAVRARTGAAIDMPPGVAAERMAARLGPAPVREVLTSLLSGSNYDYIIQASDTNEDEIASVILTPRGKDDALANTSISASNSGVRRGPGYTTSGKHTFEVMPETASESAAPTDLASTGGEEVSPPATPSTETATASAPAPADPPAEPDSSSTPAAALANSDSSPAMQNVQSGGGSAPATAFGQMVQNMQQMFEQRRQIQMQHNQAVRNQSTSPNN